MCWRAGVVEGSGAEVDSERRNSVGRASQGAQKKKNNNHPSPQNQHWASQPRAYALHNSALHASQGDFGGCGLGPPLEILGRPGLSGSERVLKMVEGRRRSADEAGALKHIFESPADAATGWLPFCCVFFVDAGGGGYVRKGSEYAGSHRNHRTRQRRIAPFRSTEDLSPVVDTPMDPGLSFGATLNLDAEGGIVALRRLE